MSSQHFVERLHDGQVLGLFRQRREEGGCYDEQYDFTSGRWVDDDTGAVASFTFRGEPSGEPVSEAEAQAMIHTGIESSTSPAH